MLRKTEKAAVTELSAFYASARKSDWVTVEKRDFYSLTYRYYGEILVESEGERLSSRGGSVTFIPKGLSYRTEIVEDMRMAAIHFKLDHDIDFRNAAVVSVESISVRQLFEKLVLSVHTDSPVDFRSMSIFYDLLAKLEELSKKEGTKQIPEKIAAVRECMEREYASPDVCVSSLADRYGISTSYLRREFLRAYGTSPISFLRAVRVANAKNMLKSGVPSIAEIAEQCGFSSPGYFIQVFHKLVGESPDRYRKRLLDAR